jgi:hypothetical protein
MSSQPRSGPPTSYGGKRRRKVEPATDGVFRVELHRVLYDGRVVELTVDTGRGARARGLWWLVPNRMQRVCPVTGATIELRELCYRTGETVAERAFASTRINRHAFDAQHPATGTAR